MILKLNARDILELTKAVRAGEVDTSKIECLRPLADSYQSKREWNDYDVFMFKKIIDAGLGFIPTPYAEWWDSVGDDMRVEILDRYGDGKVFYHKCVGEILEGVLGMYAVGMRIGYCGEDGRNENVQATFTEYLEHRNDVAHYLFSKEVERYK